MPRTTFAQDEAVAAREQWREIAHALHPRFTAAAELMDRSEKNVLADLQFPKLHWPPISSTNPLAPPP